MGQGAGWKSGGSPTSRNKNKTGTGTGTSAGGSTGGGGGGGSAGSSGGGGGTGSAGTGGVTGGGGGNGSGGSSGGSNPYSTDLTTNKPLTADFGDHISEARKKNAKFLISQLPERHRIMLEERGVKVYVDERADQSPGWAAYAEEMGIDSTDLTDDGRELGDLSFYHYGQVFVSDATPHGSVNVYTHELSHAIDYHWLDGKDVFVEYPPGSGAGRFVRTLSDDPEFVEMHTNKIFPNTHVRAYYRTGSSGDRTSGRRESFAEGYASYLAGGRAEVRKLLGSYAVADQFIRILRRQGVIN